MERVVDPGEHIVVVRTVGRRGADRVPRDRGDRGGVRTGATDVADHDRPTSIIEREDVVEVAAHIGRGARRPVPHGDAGAVDVRQARRQQRRLERAGDGALLVGQPGVLERLGDPTGDRAPQRDVVVVELTPRLGADELDRADDPTLRPHRHRDDAGQLQVVHDGREARPPASLSATRSMARSTDSALSFGNELDLAGTDHRRHAARRVGIVREAAQQLLRPGDLGRITVGDLDFGSAGTLGDEVDGAPVSELGHGGGGDVPHQLAVVGGGERRIVETVEELQPFTLEPLAVGDPFGVPDPAFGFDLQLLARRDVAGAADRAGDVALVVERHHAAAIEPVHRSVRPDRPGARARTACLRRWPARRLRGRCRRRRGASVPPTRPSCRRTHRVRARTAVPTPRPRRHTRRHVPAPRAQLACGKGQCEVIVQVRGLMRSGQSVPPPSQHVDENASPYRWRRVEHQPAASRGVTRSGDQLASRHRYHRLFSDWRGVPARRRPGRRVGCRRRRC